MALTYGFYNSVEGDRKYDAIQMGQIFDGIITDGVYATFLKAMVVKASDNPSEVIVQPGRCWFNHTWTYIDADYPVTAPVPEVILDRVDALVLDINTENAFRENSLVWVQGTPSSINPERPTLIKSVTHNQYPLCYVYRKAGTTMIYAADITNAVGTSETPFVTGVLQGINIDDLLSQWDDEFHTWEASTKTSFEGWMVNQQSVYITWFNSIKDQMEGDLTDFESWFETIQGIIDSEAATHLQAEIDDILDMLPAGSHIDISTNEQTLFNRNVTVSDGVHSKTVQFDSIGGATVESFPYIGIIDVSSTDGERIASESINIPYFGRYSVALAFWSATVSLLGDETLAGLAVTVRDGNGDVVAIVTLNGSGQGVFTATRPDTYKFIYTYGGQTMEVSLAVTQETTYEVEIHGGFNYQAWLTAGRVSESFSSLDDILEDEPTLRQLFLVHDSVDYICDTLTDGGLADITKIFNTDLAAKWINLSDYALDHFYAVDGIKSIMDTADKYGYGEWALVPQVPVMANNNTLPYGQTYASSAASGYDAYKAFDGNDTTYWQPNPTTSGSITYVFVEPVCVKKVSWKDYNGIQRTGEFRIKVKTTDDEEYITLYEGTATSPVDSVTIENDNYYKYYRFEIVNSVNNIALATLQFYAWAPKGNVPVMTSNTAPYGTTSASSVFDSRPAWRGFSDVSAVNGWTTATNASNPWLRYGFTNPVKALKARVEVFKQNVTWTAKFKIQGSNDGTTFVDISDEISIAPNTSGSALNSTGEKITVNIDTENYYLFYQIKFSTVVITGGSNFLAFKLQFYGRELKVSVPTMTSNTAPYGEAIGNNGSFTNSYYPWLAFDNTYTSQSDSWVYGGNGSNIAYCGYRFTNNTVVKCVKFMTRNEQNNDTYTRAPKSMTLRGSNNGIDWVNVSDEGALSTPSNARDKTYTYTIDNDLPYTYYRVLVNTVWDEGFVGVRELQFYGLDYSEKEFEVGATKKWLYDHGVELEDLSEHKSASYATVVFDESDALCKISGVSTQSGSYYAQIRTTNKIDLSSYNLARIKVAATYGYLRIGTSIPSNYDGSYYGAAASFTTNSPQPYNVALDVSSANQEYYIFAGTGNTNNYSDISELWLE